MDDPSLTIDMPSLKARLALVAKRELDVNECNFRGLSPILDVLPYLSLATLFLIPLNHALLFGVVSNFVDQIFDRCVRTGSGWV